MPYSRWTAILTVVALATAALVAATAAAQEDDTVSGFYPTLVTE